MDFIMPETPKAKNLPLPVKRHLRKLGQDICDARRRRRDGPDRFRGSARPRPAARSSAASGSAPGG